METTSKYRVSRALQLAFIFGFLIILITPSIVQLVHPDKSTSTQTGEKRELKKKPPFAFTKQFADSFQQYYNDRFGLREQLVRTGALYKIFLFHTAMNPEKVLYGRQDMLFYNNSDGYDHIFSSYSHTNLLPPQQLKELVESWEQRTMKLDSMGIRYIKGFWPSGQTIYPELMPFTMKMQVRDTLSKADQIVQYIRAQHSRVRFVDVRNELNGIKKVYPIYHKHDTHWNDLGAFTAYQGLFKQSPELPIKPSGRQDFELSWVKDEQADLFGMLGVPSEVGDHGKTPVLLPKDGVKGFEQVSADGFPDRTKRTICAHCGNKLKVLVFRDSYATALLQFYSRDFYEVIYVWSGYNQEIVDKVKPDIVIDIPAERYL
jgi:hypothetical protein